MQGGTVSLTSAAASGGRDVGLELDGDVTERALGLLSSHATRASNNVCQGADGLTRGGEREDLVVASDTLLQDESGLVSRRAHAIDGSVEAIPTTVASQDLLGAS